MSCFGCLQCLCPILMDGAPASKGYNYEEEDPLLKPQDLAQTGGTFRHDAAPVAKPANLAQLTALKAFARNKHGVEVLVQCEGNYSLASKTVFKLTAADFRNPNQATFVSRAKPERGNGFNGKITINCDQTDALEIECQFSRYFNEGSDIATANTHKTAIRAITTSKGLFTCSLGSSTNLFAPYGQLEEQTEDGPLVRPLNVREVRFFAPPPIAPAGFKEVPL